MKPPARYLLYLFPLLKLLIHALTATTYPFHRDEYLYLDQGNHLAWGFHEVPPMIAFLAKILNTIGASVWVTRMIPAVAGALLIYLACRLVRQLGGSNWAIIFTGVGLLFSPALLGSNTMFQPVSFNQLCWFLTAYCAVEIVRTQQNKYWYFLGLTIGLGILTKYSIAFYVLGLFAAILLTPQRKHLSNRQIFFAAGIALLIAAPNLYWQYSHEWPVFRHMAELQETQLVHMKWTDFLIPQLLFHFSFSLIWLAGFIGVFVVEKLNPYRFVAIALLITVALIGLLGGKDYYTIGAYYILFPFGGIVLEKVIAKPVWRIVLTSGMIVSILPLTPYFLPILKVEQMQSYCTHMREQYGSEFKLRWEDGVIRDLPQDVADMQGWEEMVQKVAKLYHSLSPEEKQTCHLLGGSYGHAGSLNYFRVKYNLPEAMSLNSSYLFWAEKNAEIQTQIFVDERKHSSSDWFANMIIVDSIENKYARDPGYIHWRTTPKIDVSKAWFDLVVEMQSEAGIHE